jgi:hypothetical protein
MNRSPIRHATMILALASLALSGCMSIGPRGLKLSRNEFNDAIQSTDAEELLLNIVRQRYNDPVMFLDVASVSSSISRSTNVSISGLFLGGDGKTKSTGVGGSYSDSPLIIYSPNTGERFVRQILTPMDLRTISMLLQSGWSIERVLLLAGDSFAGLKNSTTGSDSYRALVNHLRSLQRADQLSFALDTSDNIDILSIIPTSSALSSDAYKEACRLMKFPADGRPIRIQRGIGDRSDPKSNIFLSTRSLYSSFYFLSNGVESPSRDLNGGILQKRKIEGGIFDKDGNLFRVQTSRAKPQDAAVKIFYRDQWFYIPSRDPDSRTTFSLLSMMLTLQSGDTTKMTPLISISPAS